MRLDRIRPYYPKSYRFITKVLPDVTRKPRVWEAFQRYSELDERTAIMALAVNSGPTLDHRIMQLKALGELGEFNKDFPKKITIATQLLQRFEQDSDLPKLKPRIDQLMEATILHELCHWGDLRDEKQQPFEEGVHFEMQAYGHRIGKYW